MKRSFSWMALAVAIVAVAPAVLADVKTQQRSTIKIEGALGFFLNRALGGNNGIVTTVSVKGNRMAAVNEKAATIVDLAEQKIYTIDVKDKSYKVMTFAEMRKAMEDLKKQMQDQANSMSQADKDQLAEAGKQIEYDADVKDTGQHKPIAGHDARQMILTVTAHEKGKKLEDSGGFVMTNDMWLADVPVMTEVVDFHTKYFKAIFDGVFTGNDLRESTMLGAMVPGFAKAAEKMGTESRKLKGSPLMSTMTFESVKAGASTAGQSQPQQQSGGGVGGALGRMMGGNRGNTAPGGRSKLMTTTSETLSIENAVNPNDLVIPANFKEKK